MAESTTGDKKTADKTKLSEAVRIVQEAIAAEENLLKQFADREENDPIMLTGETTTGYAVQMMIDPAKVARIMLDYWYPVYTVLEEEPPQAMWNELARLTGLESVYSVDL